MNSHLEQLRHLLNTSSDLTVPWAYFHDHLSGNLALHQRGRPATNPGLEQSLRLWAARVLGKSSSPPRVLVQGLHLPQERFWHGLVLTEGRTGIYFYFEQDERGLLGLMQNLLGSEILLGRFTLLSVPQTPGVSWAHGKAAHA